MPNCLAASRCCKDATISGDRCAVETIRDTGTVCAQSVSKARYLRCVGGCIVVYRQEEHIQLAGSMGSLLGAAPDDPGG